MKISVLVLTARPPIYSSPKAALEFAEVLAPCTFKPVVFCGGVRKSVCAIAILSRKKTKPLTFHDALSPRHIGTGFCCFTGTFVCFQLKERLLFHSWCPRDSQETGLLVLNRPSGLSLTHLYDQSTPQNGRLTYDSFSPFSESLSLPERRSISCELGCPSPP